MINYANYNIIIFKYVFLCIYPCYYSFYPCYSHITTYFYNFSIGKTGFFGWLYKTDMYNYVVLNRGGTPICAYGELILAIHLTFVAIYCLLSTLTGVAHFVDIFAQNLLTFHFGCDTLVSVGEQNERKRLFHKATSKLTTIQAFQGTTSMSVRGDFQPTLH